MISPYLAIAAFAVGVLLNSSYLAIAAFAVGVLLADAVTGFNIIDLLKRTIFNKRW